MVFGQTQCLSDAVGGLEPNPVDISRQPIRVTFHHFQRLIAVLFINLDCQVGAYTMAVQEEHNFLDLLLLFPSLGDQARAFWSDVRHFSQSFRLMLDHLQGLLAKFIYDALSESGTNAFD